MSDVSGTEGSEPAAAPPVVVVKADEGHDWVEILAAILLGIAGALTAFGAYKAALTDGDALQGYTLSSKSTSEANGFYDDYAQTYNADKQLFQDYLVTINQDEELGLGLRGLFFDENLEQATVAWENLPQDERPPTALDTDDYAQPSFDEYEEYTAQAETQFEEASKADAAGDKFEQASVFLALSLFLAGVASLFKIQAVRWAGLVGAAIFIVPGIMNILDGQSALS